MSKGEEKRRKRHSLRVSWDGKAIAGVDGVSPLVRDVEVIKVREGSSPTSPLTLPGRITSEPVTIERPAGGDTAFEQWATAVGSRGARKDVTVEVLDRDGGVLLAYRLRDCWPSEYRVELLGPRARAAAVEQLRLENDGWDHI